MDIPTRQQTFHSVLCPILEWLPYWTSERRSLLQVGASGSCGRGSLTGAAVCIAAPDIKKRLDILQHLSVLVHTDTETYKHMIWRKFHAQRARETGG